MDYKDQNEEAVVMAAKKGDDEAFTYIIEKYKVLVRAKSRIYFVAGGDKEDIIQEGMIGLFKAVKDFDDSMNNSFRSFAEICVTRQIITAIKTATRQKHQPLNSYISFSKPLFEEDNDKTYLDSLIQNEHENPEQLIIVQEEAKTLVNFLSEKLSRMETEVLNRYLMGSSYIEIANEMKKSPKSIDNALSRIKKKAGSVQF